MSNAGYYMKALNVLSVEAQGKFLTAGNGLVGIVQDEGNFADSSAIKKGKEMEGTVAVMRNLYFDIALMKPFLIVNFGETSSITDPERSIEVGIKHFKKVFKQAGGDVRLTLQAYNFGSGFIDYVKKNGGKYTKKLALDFSRLQAFKMGWKSYGDPSYVDHVMRYVKGSDKNVKPVNGSMDFYETVMKEALKYEGQPYAWGGLNPKTGFDCSGLVQWSFAKAGITLPRTAQEQHGATKKISEKEATAGNLVFFGGTYEGKAITHVGIYVGNGRISAPMPSIVI